MAELLVRVVDKVNKDFYLNCACTKRGDVIAVCPDGWPWGTAELANPDYRILTTDLSVSEASVFLAPERDTDPTQPSRTLRLRQFKIDLDNPALDTLRDFLDVPDVVDVAPQDGKSLDDIAVVDTVTSHLEDVAVAKDGTAAVSKTTIVEEKTTYPVDLVADDLRASLATLAVAVVGPQVRRYIVAPVSGDLLNKLKVMKPPVADPNQLGLAPTIF